jgi:hypothetical protein
LRPSRPPPRQILGEVLAHILRIYGQQPDLHALIRPPHLELRLRPDRRPSLRVVWQELRVHEPADRKTDIDEHVDSTGSRYMNNPPLKPLPETQPGTDRRPLLRRDHRTILPPNTGPDRRPFRG